MRNYVDSFYESCNTYFMDPTTSHEEPSHISDVPQPKDRWFLDKKVLIPSLCTIILLGVGTVIYFLYVSVHKSESQQASPNQNFVQQTTTENTENKLPPCSTNFGMVEPPQAYAHGAFTSAITNTDLLAVISPGKLVGDARFTYLWIRNGQSVPIFAPANGVLVQIFYKIRADLSSDLSKPDYDLVFLVDCHTLYRINHVTDPIDQLAVQKPINHPLQLKPGSGYNDKDTLPKNRIIVKAGQQIGTTTGTPSAHNFDFGIFVDRQAVCPYEQFPEPIRSHFLALLGNTTQPLKGTLCDVNGMY